MGLDQANNVEYEVFLQWLNEETVKKISADLKEPDWMLEKRLEALKIFYELIQVCIIKLNLSYFLKSSGSFFIFPILFVIVLLT